MAGSPEFQDTVSLIGPALSVLRSPSLSLSLSYITGFAALLSLPAAFVFPASSSSSSYFIPRIITPLTSEPNTFIANQLLLRTTFMASQTSSKEEP